MKKILVFLLAVLTLTSCAKNEDSSGTESLVREKEGVSLIRLTMPSEPDSLDPYISTASDTEAVMHNVYEGLVLFDENGSIIPGLAESWEISDDGLEYTFHLRNDVTFHSGEHMDSADVAYSFKIISGLSTGEPISSRFSTITAIETPDEYTVILKLSEPNAAFLEGTRVGIIPEGYTDSASAPIGTGPYEFVEYTQGSV